MIAIQAAIVPRGMPDSPNRNNTSRSPPNNRNVAPQIKAIMERMSLVLRDIVSDYLGIHGKSIFEDDEQKG